METQSGRMAHWCRLFHSDDHTSSMDIGLDLAIRCDAREVNVLPLALVDYKVMLSRANSTRLTKYPADSIAPTADLMAPSRVAASLLKATSKPSG
jgi:hypothetical protein